MPHLRFRGVQDSTVAMISQNAIQLADIIKTETQNFTFEKILTQFFEAGQFHLGNPFVEVFWFPRDEFTKQETAKYLTQSILQLEPHECVTVVFHDLNKNAYFENGKSF